MNLCIFRGNITKETQLKYLPSGTALLSFDLAVNYRYGKEQKTLFIKCNLFGKRAEGLAQYLTKGTNIIVDGMLTENNWTGNDGKIRYSKELLVSSVEFAGCKSNTNQTNQAHNTGNYAANTTNQSNTPQTPAMDFNEGDIPF